MTDDLQLVIMTGLIFLHLLVSRLALLEFPEETILAEGTIPAKVNHDHKVLHGRSRDLRDVSPIKRHESQLGHLWVKIQERRWVAR